MTPEHSEDLPDRLDSSRNPSRAVTYPIDTSSFAVQDSHDNSDYSDPQTPRVRSQSTLENNEYEFTARLSHDLESRHFSSPLSVTSSRRRRRSTDPRRAHTALQERPWSVFEQLMENEGQIRSPGNRRLRQRTSNNALSASWASLNDPVSSSHSTSEAAGSMIQSPVADYFNNNDPFSESYASRHHTDSTEHNSTEYDSDSDTSTVDYTSPQSDAPHPVFSTKRLPNIPTLYRNIFKCALAYFFASLFTFVPYFSGIISDVSGAAAGGLPSPSGHMVATVAVYFNPAKTIGGMVEADVYCLMGLLYSAFVCLGSAGMYWWLEEKPGWEWLADILVILWIGVGMSVVSWMKVWMAKPSFNTACSLTSIVLFVVIVKEGGLRQFLEVAFIVLIGSTTANVVCYVIWPQSATTNLQDNMIKTLDSFSTLLQILTNTFLLEEPLHQPSHEKLQKAVESHQSSFTSLKKILSEAHSEWFYGGPRGDGPQSSGKAYQDAVDSLNRLAQHLNGLRSGTRLQYELTKAHSDGKLDLKHLGTSRHRTSDIPSGGIHGILDESDHNGSHDTDNLLRAAAIMFGDLVDDLGPPLKALSNTCTSSLKRLREAFALRHRTGHKNVIEPHEFMDLVNGIERALYTFESTSNHAMMRLYRRSELSTAPSTASLGSSENYMLTSTGRAHEHVFLVYFFIFTMEEFARELESLVDAMSRIYSIEQLRISRGNWFRRIFTCIRSKCRISSSRHRARKENTNSSGLRRRLSEYIIPENRRPLVLFPKIRPHAPNTVQTPSRNELPWMGRAKQTLWALGARLKEPDLKFAFKSGMATAVLASPAFFDSTKPIFQEYRGEWALISHFVVLSPTIGATNFLSVARILGTLFGAASATIVFTAFSELPVVLSLFGFFYSIPCFYCILAMPEYATAGRFVLLTYNLTCLYCYNLREKDVLVYNIAYHRSIAVTVGVIWAALVSRFWWPAEARRELSKRLGEFCLNLGWLYTRLVASNSYAPDVQTPRNEYERNRTPPTESTPLIATQRSVSKVKLTTSIQEFMAMELHLQIKLIELQGLLAQTQHEPRLKGPFPVQLYRSILTSLQTILDRLHSMRCVTTREEWYTSVRQDFIIPVNKERHEMVGNIILYFSTLASAFRLKAPLPPYLPPAEKSRQRLVDAIRRLDIVKNRDVKGSKQLLFFAYALTMQGVTQELETLGQTLQTAFGVIGQTREEFEALFRDEGVRIGQIA